MRCEAAMISFCPKNHPRSYKCHLLPPNSCAKCDDEYARKLKEEQEAEYQRAYRAKRLAELNDIDLRRRESLRYYGRFGEGPRSVAGPVTRTSSHRLFRMPNPSATLSSTSTSGIFEAPNRIPKPDLISRISSPSQHWDMPRTSQGLPHLYKTEFRHDTGRASRTLYVHNAGVAYSNWSQNAVDRAREEDAQRRTEHALRAQQYQDAKMARRQAEHRERKGGLDARMSDWPTEPQHQNLQRERIEHGQGAWSGGKRKRDSQEEVMIWRPDKRSRQDTERRRGRA